MLCLYPLSPSMTGSHSHPSSGLPQPPQVPTVWSCAVLCFCTVWLDSPRTIPPQGMEPGHNVTQTLIPILIPLSTIPQFTDFICTVETLFSLLNGDDIYNTYIQIDAQVDLLAYIYSRFFLYTFLFLFIYTVLNLFTSLIISAYEISQVCM